MIVVDTSALMALLLAEPQADQIAAILQAEDDVVISAGTFAEALFLAARRSVSEELTLLVDGIGIRVDNERAKPGLLEELEENPASEIVTALAGILDDDIITRLGRCAMKRGRLREQIIEELESSGESRALKLVERLKGLK